MPTERAVTGFSFADIDPLELLQRLTLHAYLVFGCFPEAHFEPVLAAHGESPEDLAMEVIQKLLDPDDPTVAWNPNRGQLTLGGLLRYLEQVLLNDFIDRKRSKRFECHAELPPVELQDGTGLTLEGLTKHLDTPEAIAIRPHQHERIIERFREEPELQDVLGVQLDPDGWYNAYTNEELATLLGTSVADIENRKKRILRRLMKLYKEQREARAVSTK